MATVLRDGGVPASSPPGGRLGRLLARYEIVIATVAVIVVIARLGGETVDPLPSLLPDAPAVAPFAEALPVPDSVPAFIPAPDGSGLALPAVANLAAPAALAPAASQPAAFADGGTFGDVAGFALLPHPGAPAAIVVGPAGDAFVATDNADGRGEAGPPRITQLAPDGTVAASVEVQGSNGITALAFGRTGALYALSRSPAAVVTIDPATGATTTYATIPDVAPCVPVVLATSCDGSLANGAPLPSAFAFDTAGTIYVADAGQGAVWRVAPGSKQVSQLIVDPTWTHPATPSGPTGLALDGNGNLVVVVRSLLTEDVGVVYLQALTRDGTAGTRTEVARTETGARPYGLALGQSGRLYLTLSGTDRVLVLEPDGEVVGTVAGLATPAGIAFRGRSVLVTNLSPGNPGAASVVRLPIGEGGGTVLPGP
jgi:sugar lactone lactonase YvrE